ncbi:hypothetical protein D917_03308 [Trichinella nativa]|uniref:Uncharacterized protein n=1 Tax=Trichinella nativa TaxID=6335 RepID=A0A1Y3E8Q7_9BILA|nr:hypothetical protein D917_03308 [Trichinella nativa]
MLSFSDNTLKSFKLKLGFGGGDDDFIMPLDTSLAVDSSENQVDEEDVLLGSALEKTLLQLNSANTGPADDGHSSLTVDQSMDEQSDSGIRNRLRPRPRRSKIPAGM